MKTQIKKRGTVIAAVALASLLAGCASFSQPPRTFELAAPAGPPRAAATSRAQILIAEPTAVRTLDSQQIAIMPSALTVEYVAESQWSDRLPRLVQLRLLQAFQNTGRIGAVGVPGQGLAIDYQIVTEIRRFEISLETGSAVVEISVKALNDRSGQVRSSQIFTASVPLAGAGSDNYVVALNAAFGQVSDSIVGWALRLL